MPIECLFLLKKTKYAELVDKLLKATQIPQIGENDVIVTNLRHYEALSQALLLFVECKKVYKNISPAIS